MSRPQPSAATTWSSGLARITRERRRVLGLSQAELAELAGCGTAFLYALEHGKPSLRMDKVVGVLSVLGLRLRVEVGPEGLTVAEELP